MGARILAVRPPGGGTINNADATASMLMLGTAADLVAIGIAGDTCRHLRS
jgi:hypothetical protein